MNNNLAPTYEKLFGDFWVLWFSKSNSYSVVDHIFKRVLDYYLKSNSIDDFNEKIDRNDYSLDFNATLKSVESFLENSNKKYSLNNKSDCILDKRNRNILKQYKILGKGIQVYYDSELVLKTIHPNLAHLTSKIEEDTKITFDIYLKDDQLYLFKNGQIITKVPKRDYHHIQGKFIMHLLCTIHEKNEKDWIGMLHGSTITDGKSSILFVGNSGSGKSTLCALLTASGFDLLADDVSPLLSENKEIYYNPSAISIKKGAFKVLNPIINSFNSYPEIEFNTTKGTIKYIPCNAPKKNHYPCDKIVLVNYKNKVETSLKRISIKLFLETLIPDSWLSPDLEHAKQFLDWLGTLHIYTLTYSDSKSGVSKISELFEESYKSQ